MNRFDMDCVKNTVHNRSIQAEGLDFDPERIKEWWRFFISGRCFSGIGVGFFDKNAEVGCNYSMSVCTQ